MFRPQTGTQTKKGCWVLMYIVYGLGLGFRLAGLETMNLKPAYSPKSPLDCS